LGNPQEHPDKVLPMNEVTRILSAIEQGDPHAPEQQLPLVYDELRELAAERIAPERPGQTLQATALVHEAYLRLAEGGQTRALEQPGTLLRAAPKPCAASSSKSARRKRRHKHGRRPRARADRDGPPADPHVFRRN